LLFPLARVRPSVLRVRTLISQSLALGSEQCTLGAFLILNAKARAVAIAEIELRKVAVQVLL